MHGEPTAAARLLDAASIEMTAAEIDALTPASRLLARGTRVNVTFLARESADERVLAAAAVREAGLVPVPHVAARRLASHEELDALLDAIVEASMADAAMVVGGDPHEPLGPFPDARSVIAGGMLAHHGFRDVSIAGYPEGHPDIDDDTLWDALESKVDATRAMGARCSIITQVSFDDVAVREWIELVRARGIDATIRVGVPGPTGVRRLLAFARRLGVATTAAKAARYGFSLTHLVGTAGPDRFVTALASDLTGAHGDVRVHLYPFGDLEASAGWLHDMTEGVAA